MGKDLEDVEKRTEKWRSRGMAEENFDGAK